MNMTSTAEPALTRTRDTDRAVGVWVAISAGMVLIMMIIGAITRLTESGLSMVEWRPLIGTLPPLSEVEWQRIFDLYRQTSEYQIDNAGMNLAEFKTIFWWEYIHRVWGRLIGLVFGIPLVWFWVKGQLPAQWKLHLLILLILGGLQGVIGWWMVKSGFVDRDDVSQYRLAVHLGMAFFILGYLFWVAHGILTSVPKDSPKTDRGFRRLGAWCHAVIFFTVISGALVAGLNAGFIYNDWPLMAGEWIPSDIWDPALGGLNFFENMATVQFDHRLFAYGTLAVVTLTWVVARRQPLTTRARLSINALFVAVWVQAGLGISTLMLIIPLPLAVLHQLGAATCFCLSLWVIKELRGPRPA